MIAKLKGLVDAVGDDFAVIDVGGVGYLVFASARTLGKLAVGEAAVLHIETHVREDHIHLYGFGDPSEREWFRLLTTVQGVGSKVGLALLSVLPPEQLAQAIAAQDKAALARANGVGPKLAARVCSELKDKVGSIALGAFAAGGAVAAGVAPISETAGGALGDAVSALVNLGYRRMDAHAAVLRVSAQAGEGAEMGTLVRLALKELASV